jgi:fluoride ion exporter CrcB/FEX
MNLMRAIGGGILAELLLIVVLMPVVFIFYDLDTLQNPDNLPLAIAFIVVAGSFVMPAFMTQWVAKRATSRLVLHGLLVGFTAFVVYATPMLLAGERQPPIYWVAHAMKILGGLTGGLVAARRHASRGTAVTV